MRTVRAPMPRSRRAKQFMPFTMPGLKEAIAAKERVTEPIRELAEDSIAEINKILKELQKGQIITVVYYGIYEQNYLQLTGPVTKIDPYWRCLQIGNTTLSFPEIYQIATGAVAVPAIASQRTQHCTFLNKKDKNFLCCILPYRLS